MSRFSIRDVLWLTAVVALGLAWWADHTASATRFVECQRLVHLLNTEGQETLRAIEDSGHVVVERFGQIKLEKGR